MYSTDCLPVKKTGGKLVEYSWKTGGNLVYDPRGFHVDFKIFFHEFSTSFFLKAIFKLFRKVRIEKLVDQLADLLAVIFMVFKRHKINMSQTLKV